MNGPHKVERDDSRTGEGGTAKKSDGESLTRMLRHEFPQIPEELLPQGHIPGIRRLTHTVGDPSWYYALHEHADAVEFMYVAGGTADIVMGRQAVTVRAGDVVLIGEGVAHSIASHAADPSDVWTFTVVRAGFGGQDGGMAAMHTQAGENNEFIAETMARLEMFSKRQDMGSRIACDHLCAALLALFRQSMFLPSPVHKTRSKTLPDRILKYINENYAQDMDLGVLAAVFGVSASHISREFKRAHGISPINYLIDKRLSEAKWLLINTGDPVWGVAEKVGYQNPYYFTKLFSSRVGDSPAEYRGKHRKG